MAETANIAAMASKVSDELFGVFGWRQAGSADQNWPCVDTNHGRRTHPSDVVFFYDEPYSAVRTYLNCDLKSYKRGSITATSIRTAVENLAQSVACAENSKEWQGKYVHKNVSASICGLLFVYNHDGEYDADFQTLLDDIVPSKVAVSKGSKLVVLGPHDVFWLDNVRNDIETSRGKKVIPEQDSCRFLYPDLVLRKLIQSKDRTAATIETLTSPWIMLESVNESGMRTAVDIYYREKGNTADEFLYLIDWLLHYNVVQPAVTIRIKTLNAHPESTSFFDRAKQTYVDNYGRLIGVRADRQQKTSNLAKRLDAISCRQMTRVVSTFSEVEMGMDYD